MGASLFADQSIPGFFRVIHQTESGDCWDLFARLDQNPFAKTAAGKAATQPASTQLQGCGCQDILFHQITEILEIITLGLAGSDQESCGTADESISAKPAQGVGISLYCCLQLEARLRAEWSNGICCNKILEQPYDGCGDRCAPETAAGKALRDELDDRFTKNWHMADERDEGCDL